ncbi:hypothetical protein FRC03_002702 [Tulasnella sp. 419]|nr:hypothetical protein FRC03_002702 [Tulasnella sp. 419]
MDQLPFSGVEDNDDVLSYRRPQPPRYRRRGRRIVNGINVESQSVPSPGRYYHRARRARSRSVSSSYSSPVQEQPRHRKSEKKKELKRKKRHTSLSPPPPPRRRSSSGLPWYIRPFLPSLGSCTLIIVSVAIILVSMLCFVIRRDVISMLQIGSHYVETIAIRPLQAIQNGTLNVFTSMWCGTLEWWCMATPKANKTFHARKFHDLPTTPCPEERFAELPKLDVSLGNSFFDCLEDLGRVRGYKTELAHLLTLFAHVKQVEWLLEDPDDLYDDLYSLAQQG